MTRLSYSLTSQSTFFFRFFGSYETTFYLGVFLRVTIFFIFYFNDSEGRKDDRIFYNYDLILRRSRLSWPFQTCAEFFFVHSGGFSRPSFIFDDPEKGTRRSFINMILKG